MDWVSVIVDEKPQVSIQSVKTDKEMVNSGEQITGSINLQSDNKSSCVLTVSLLDNYDRLLDKQEFEVLVQDESSQAFVLNTSGALTHLAKIDCEIKAQGLVQDREVAEVFVRQTRVWDDYDIVMYLFGPNSMPGIWPTIDRQMQRLYVTTLSSYPLDHCKHANYMVQAQTRISGQESPDGGPDRTYYDEMKKKYVETKDKAVLKRKYCLHDPAYKEQISRELKELCTPWVPFSPLSYYVYEEPSFTCYGDALDLCFSEHSLKAMREWLKAQYNSLQALNTQWGTKFISWDQVVPDDTYEAQKRGNYAGWADHRTFMEKSYADCYKYVLEELRKLDPQAIVLNSGTQESMPHNACDYSQLNLYTKHLNAYQYEIHRSMNPGVKISAGSGYGVMGKRVFNDLYERLFKGANGGCYIFWQYCTIDPDLTLNQSARDMEEGLREMRGEGIGKLVGLALPDNHGIAIHYSYPSIHGSWIVDGVIKERVTYNTSETFNRFSRNGEGWMNILRDSGLQFDFLSYGALEKGELISKGYKTFVLPMSVSLSSEEVEALSRFVEQGGTLIADALPGAMDEHCTFRKDRVLQDVFGVRFSATDREDIAAMSGEPKLKLKGAKALSKTDGQPILVYNEFGSGKAFLLNYFLDSYLDDKRENRNQKDLENILRVLETAGIQPKIKLTTLAGEPVTTCERYLFNNGTTGLLGLMPNMYMEGSQKVRISLPGSFTVYDVRNKRYISAGEEFETEIEPGVPALFAMVAGRIRGLQLDAPRSAKLGEEVKATFRVEGLSDLSSVAKITVTSPDGNHLRFYGENTDITASTGSVSFKTALNDPKGDWVVKITEAMSGESSRAVVSVN
ncbi:beta-galactosidase [Gemmatimonadota bacterium]